MKTSFLSILLAAWLLAFGATQFAFGWSSTNILGIGNTHALITKAALSSPIFSTTNNAYGVSLLSMCPSVDWGAVRDYSSEPSGSFHTNVVIGNAWHGPEWEDTSSRSYLDTAGTSPLGNNWNSLDETTRLQYLCHLTGDTSVPSLWHFPAYEVNQNTGIESAIEQGVGTWNEVNSKANSCVISGNYNGHAYNYIYTGTIFDVINAHHSAVLDNATWARDHCSTGDWKGAYFGDYLGDKSDYDFAANRGTEMAQMYQRAVVADYILAKQTPVAIAPNYTHAYGGSITLDESSSYDPDAISWNANATYSQIYGANAQGIVECMWDFDRNGTWDATAENTNILPVSTVTLVNNYHMQLYTANNYTVRVIDNEGKYSDAVGSITIMPEPASLTLAAIGFVAFFFVQRIRRRLA